MAFLPIVLADAVLVVLLRSWVGCYISYDLGFLASPKASSQPASVLSPVFLHHLYPPRLRLRAREKFLFLLFLHIFIPTVPQVARAKSFCFWFLKEIASFAIETSFFTYLKLAPYIPSPLRS